MDNTLGKGKNFDVLASLLDPVGKGPDDSKAGGIEVFGAGEVNNDLTLQGRWVVQMHFEKFVGVKIDFSGTSHARLAVFVSDSDGELGFGRQK
ncbi:MAG TPA: hypothetical protein VJK26_03730 [Patescibacteria group bacterium]|nr:hypothetical protein [Patescibacteria group bacterium]